MDIFIRFRDFCYYNRKIICFVLVVSFFILFFYFEFSFSSVEENIVSEVVLEKTNEVALDNEDDCLIVDIKGAIISPGTYKVSNENRIIDQTTPNMIQRISGTFERKPLISKEI